MISYILTRQLCTRGGLGVDGDACSAVKKLTYCEIIYFLRQREFGIGFKNSLGVFIRYAIEVETLFRCIYSMLFNLWFLQH